MRAKKILQITALAILMAMALPASSATVAPGSYPVSSTPATEDARLQQLVHRLEDIKGMDKSDLTRLEKKSLRKEIKGIKKELKDRGGKGVYLSVGAIIIIILLLILIL